MLSNFDQLVLNRLHTSFSLKFIVDDSVTFTCFQVCSSSESKFRHKNCYFFLFEHLLCRESIVIVKKFDFEIFTYLYVLRSPEFIYAIFAEMYVCVCVCVYIWVCVYEWTECKKGSTRLKNGKLLNLRRCILSKWMS